MNIAKKNIVQNKLTDLHADAAKDFMRMGRGIAKSIFRPIQPADFENVYLPISKEQGDYIHQLIIDKDCKNIVEFGTSFGISTIYFATAAEQIGGHVVTTELLPSKAKKAASNITDAGLNEFVTIKIGDAMETLQNHNEPIDFLFLDGWKDLYLPVFALLEKHFHPGTIIYADNMDMSGTRKYADYVLSKRDIYKTQIIHEGKGFLTTTH